MQQENIIYVTHKEIKPNPLNPRKDHGDLTELVTSIEEHGIIEPLIVRIIKSHSDPVEYELIAGERRHAAIGISIKQKGLKKDFQIPVIVRNLDDNATIQVMLIENLMRKDLSDYEQAESFREYVNASADADAALFELSQKTGLGPFYIRKRIHVLSLRKELLDMWKEGTIAYSHLEQFLRASDEIIGEFLSHALTSYVWSVAKLKERIDSADCLLSKAIFDKKAAGCTNCKMSSAVQKSLFGDDFKMNKVTCTNPKCFKENTHKYLSEHWKETEHAKQYGTNDFVIYNYCQVKGFPRDVQFEKCNECKSFCTALYSTGNAAVGKLCADTGDCYQTLLDAQRAAEGKIPAKQEEAQKEAQSKAEKKAEKHGTEFSELFFKENLPGKVATIMADDPTSLIMTALVLYKRNPVAADVIFKEANPDINMNPTSYNEVMDLRKRKDDFPLTFLSLSRGQAMAMVQKLSTLSILDEKNFTLSERMAIADKMDLRLERDFLITREYLEKKTKTELYEMGAKWKIWDTDAGTREVAKLQHGGASDLKKTAMIEVFLANDLSGLVPDEIAAMKA